MKRVLLSMLVVAFVVPSAWTSTASPLATRSGKLSGPVVRVQPGNIAHLEGRIPARGQQIVRLQQLTKQGWTEVRREKTNDRGEFGFQVTASSHVGTTTYRAVGGERKTNTTKVQVVKAGRWRELSNNGSYTCGIKRDRSGWCWGRGDSGQLGIGGTPSSVRAPRKLPGTWKTLVTSAGKSTCGIQTDDSGWCWGVNAGNGSSSEVPVQLPGTWRAFMPNSYYEFGGDWNTTNCGIRTDDTAWCWGTNHAGEVGTGFEPALTPHQLPGLWREISYAARTQCGIRTDGTGWCWGLNHIGQVGDGTTESRSSPVQLAGTWRSLAPTDHGTTCGVRTDSTAWCWGSDPGTGRWGTGTIRPTPYQLPGLWDSLDWSTQVLCGIQQDRSGWCWGWNASGGVGDGTREPRLTPYRLAGTWSSLAPSCGVKTNGTGWCWGSNSSGKLGDGTTKDRLTPTRLPGRWTSIEPGFTPCGFRPDASVACWGMNHAGGVGNGTAKDRLTPYRLSGQWRLLLSSDTKCGIRTGGTAWCWRGQLERPDRVRTEGRGDPTRRAALTLQPPASTSPEQRDQQRAH